MDVIFHQLGKLAAARSVAESATSLDLRHRMDRIRYLALPSAAMSSSIAKRRPTRCDDSLRYIYQIILSVGPRVYKARRQFQLASTSARSGNPL